MLSTLIRGATLALAGSVVAALAILFSSAPVAERIRTSGADADQDGRSSVPDTIESDDQSEAVGTLPFGEPPDDATLAKDATGELAGGPEGGSTTRLQVETGEAAIGGTEAATGSTEVATGSTEVATGSTQAGTGSTQAGAASTQADASTQAGTASTPAGTSTQAGTGGTQAGTAGTTPIGGATNPDGTVDGGSRPRSGPPTSAGGGPVTNPAVVVVTVRDAPGTTPTTVSAPATTSRPSGSASGPWSVLSALPVVDPRDFGAVGDGRADDTAALQRAIDSLPGTGGIVYIGDGRVYRTTNVIRIGKDHVKLWSRSGRGRIYTATGGAKRRQALICEDVDGCGFFGLHFQSDAPKRLYALEDSHVVLDGVTNGEVVGVEIEGSASAAVFIFGRSRNTYIEGNYIHNTWSDGVHFTNGSRGAWVWDNTYYNDALTKGDDGVACVTYANDAHCGDMEWWNNDHLGGGWGRGFSVIGGDRIQIHHNFARDVAGAGIIVASEPSYDTPTSSNISIQSNVLYRTGRVIPHSGILISALRSPISNVSVTNNVVVDSANNEPYRDEGDTSAITMSNTMSSADRLPSRLPAIADGPRPKNTDVMKTRDTSFVPVADRRGLYRIHVRRSTNGTGFEQRFEYVVAGTAAAVERWLGAHGDSETAYKAAVGSDTAVVLLSPRPIAVPTELRPIGFSELRTGDRSGALARLWETVNG